MAEEKYVPVTEDDLGLTPQQIRELVTGAQKYLPPDDEDEEEDDEDEPSETTST